MQPLDDVPYASFKTNFQDQLVKFNEESVGRKLGKTEFFKLFIPAFEKAFTYANIQAGFRNCGIYPPNPHAAKLILIGASATVDAYNSKFLLEVTFVAVTLVFCSVQAAQDNAYYFTYA